MTQVKVAIVGCGIVAQQDYFPVLATKEIRSKIEVTAICDVVPGRAQEMCDKYGFGAAYSDYDAMLQNAEADLVAILTPIPLHYRQALAALNAGKNVYVQKTMTTTSEEALELTRIAIAKGLIIGASPGQMLNRYHKAAKKIIDSGKIGKVCFVRGQGPHPGHEMEDLKGIDPSWYYKHGGGPMMDVAVYPLTSITGILGPAKRVTALSGVAVPDRYWEGKKLDVQMDDNTVVLIDYGDGVFASVQGNYVTRSFNTPQFEFFGSKGTVVIGGWMRSDVALEVFTPEEGWTRPEVEVEEDAPSIPMMHTMVDLLHMVRCIKGETELQLGGDRVAHVIEIIEKAYESARTGMAQDLNTTFSLERTLELNR
ncbi:Gfo/Idh/MocA family oxidoreductase [Paenibacillus frigoriresistens]|uniref:Gfo/Idh/MocA family protein n=1 Tax=Paenibacillus alginolyticus TaxID=59839 RepID=UPI001567597B|nr:Gfo/Idh/MocA family oxidoreductase [Paenibacillus frigoriresistens]NRF90368.1 Gfo/Idh/MocA family oxidoreductase [Paenibacillus frigoriresistens]